MVRTWSRLFPNPGYYGWVIVGMGFLCSTLSSPGQSFAISLYLEALMVDLDLSRVQLSSLYAGATLLAAVCLPFLGSWADRLPSGPYLAGVLGALALAMFGFAGAQSAAALAVAFFFLRLLGQGAIGLGTLTTTVQWFHRYRGRALAVVSLGYALGQMVFPSVIYGLIELVGWRGSLVALGVLYLAVFTPLIATRMRDRCEGDAPMDGAEEACGAAQGGGAATVRAETSYSLAQAVRMPVFWGILLCVSVPPLVSTAVIFHQVALFGSLGWAPGLIPLTFMVMAVASVVMTYLSGLLLERMPSRWGVALSLGLSALAFASMLLPLPPLVGALMYGSLLGLGSGANAAASSIVWPDYFGTEALGAVKGVVNAVRNAASAAGPPVAAFAVAAHGSFGVALAAFALMSAAASVASLFLRPPYEAALDEEETPINTLPLGVRVAAHGRAA